MAKEYPLHQLQVIKKKKLEEAERVLREKKEKLAAEEEKLKKLEDERDKVKKHRQDKLTQLRAALDEGMRTDKIEQMRLYMKLVDEKLKVHEKKVADQIKQVEKAELEVEEARKAMVKREREVEKLKEHAHEWKKEEAKELEKEEAKETDEMGSTRFIMKKKKREKDG